MSLRPLSCARENARLREAVERLGLLNEDKDAVIAGLRAQLAGQAEQIARLERLISRDSGPSLGARPGGADLRLPAGRRCSAQLAVTFAARDLPAAGHRETIGQ